MFRKMLLASALLVSLSLTAAAAPTISAGSHQLLPNTAGQVIPILVSGEGAQDAFLGTDLYLTVGGGTDGPIITGLELVSGTVFDGNANAPTSYGPPYDPPTRELYGGVSTLVGSVGPNGVLALVTLDTTGVELGDYSLSLTNGLFGGSAVYTALGDPTTLIDGNLSVVPEPGSIVLALFGAAGMTALAIRRRRQIA